MQVLSTVRNLLASLVVFIIKSLSWDWREPQQSRTLAALAEDESSVPSTHMAGAILTQAATVSMLVFPHPRQSLYQWSTLAALNIFKNTHIA